MLHRFVVAMEIKYHRRSHRNSYYLKNQYEDFFLTISKSKIFIPLQKPQIIRIFQLVTVANFDI